MNRILKLSVISFLIFSFMMACKKDNKIDEVPLDDPSYHNYSQLKVGNYWEYELFYGYNIDTLADSLTSQHIFERMQIEKDTIMYGKRFFKRTTTYSNYPQALLIEYLRDSANYILIIKPGQGSTAYKEFSSLPYDTIKKCSDFFGCFNIHMAGYDSIVLPTGNFKTLSYHRTINYPSSSTAYFTSEDEGYYYAENYGMVLRRRFTIERDPCCNYNITSEARLINYYVGQ